MLYCSTNSLVDLLLKLLRENRNSFFAEYFSTVATYCIRIFNSIFSLRFATFEERCLLGSFWSWFDEHSDVSCSSPIFLHLAEVRDGTENCLLWHDHGKGFSLLFYTHF